LFWHASRPQDSSSQFPLPRPYSNLQPHLQMASNSCVKLTPLRCLPLLIITTDQVLNTLQSGISVVLRSVKRNPPWFHSRSLVRILMISVWGVPILFLLSVLRAKNLPRLKTFLRKKRKFYATIIYRETTTRTRSVRSMGQCVEWNERMDALWEISCSFSLRTTKLLQRCTTSFPHDCISLCGHEHPERHPCWEAGDSL
jgi:hypothetical protein